MKKEYLRFSSILVLSVFLAGCGSSPTSIAVPVTGPEETAATASQAASPISPTSTPDACATGQIEAAVQKVHYHMREFDDASILASNMPREELSDSIANLQRIRREAEDEQIPGCLTNLKNYQLDHMNSVIDVLVAFIGGTDVTTLEQGIAVAREQHDQYALELARLLGITVVPATVPVINTPAQTITP
jgi:hypothetical protein